MMSQFREERPIYQQIADKLEDAILSGAFPEESQLPSTTEISVNYRINPATALKGINRLVDLGAAYKKRGLGMFVKTGAREIIMEKRKQSFFESYVAELIAEAKKLGVSKEEILQMMERGYEREQA